MWRLPCALAAPADSASAKPLRNPRTLRTLCAAGPGLLARDQAPCPELGTVEEGSAAHDDLSISEVDDRVNSLGRGN